MEEEITNDIFNMMLAIEEQKDFDVSLAANDQQKMMHKPGKSNMSSTYDVVLPPLSPKDSQQKELSI